MMEQTFEYLITFDAERCLQCYACEVACAMWRGLDGGKKFRRIFPVMDGSYPDTGHRSVSVACVHCVEPACVAVCPVDALSKRAEDGLVLVDEARCIGCGKCLRACPFDVPQVERRGKMSKCDCCTDIDYGGAPPPCVATCPGKALTLQRVSRETKQAYERSLAETLKKAQRS